MLTIAIPSFQRRGHLARLLDSVEGAVTATPGAKERVEVVIVLDGSTDGSDTLVADRATRFPVPLRAVWQENQGAATARNRCADEAAGELVWFLDDDMTISPRALATHLGWDRTVTPMLMGPCTIRSDDVSASAAKQWYDERWAKLATIDRLTDPVDITFANASLPVALLREHRFSERFHGYGPEDLELAIRFVDAGVPVGYSADADVQHDFAPTPDERLRKLRQEGRNRMLLLELHPHRRDLAFADEPGRFELAARRVSGAPGGAPLLWAVARALSQVGRWSSRLTVRCQNLAETAALYAGVAGARRDGHVATAW